MNRYFSALSAFAFAALAAPQAGDESRPWLWAAIAGVALVLVIVMIFIGKKGKDDGDGDDK